MTEPSHEIRLAELLGGLTLACDLVNGFAPEKVLRTAVLAVAVGERAGLDTGTRRDAFYVTLLRFLGCTGFAHEEAAIYGAGNDLSVRHTMAMADATNPVGTLSAIAANVGEGSAVSGRARAVANLIFTDAAAKHARAQCDSSLMLAELVGAGESVRAGLAQICERYDGKGFPEHRAGEELPLAIRLHHVADIAELAHQREGREAAVAELRRRAGKHLDPSLAKIFIDGAGMLFDEITRPASIWERYLASEPAPVITASADRCDDVATAFALFADLKSVYTIGHSTGVAALVARAATDAGIDPVALRDLRHAALLHDIGRVSVPNSIWDKRGALDVAEWERVRLHAYYTERVVLRAPVWKGAARLASAAHERLDASGYPRGVPTSLIARPERLLAAADVFHALREARPHREALAIDDAKNVMLEEVRGGRLDRDAVDAVLGAVGAIAKAPRGTWPRGLSDREVEVLRLVARGKSNREIGTLLGISHRTAQNHVAHIYDKIGVYSRAGAALFAMENDVL